MTVARSYSPTPSPSRLIPSQRTLRRSQPRSLPSSTVTKLPQERIQLPQSLQFMLLIQKSSAAFTFVIVSITLAVYGWTVCAPSLWSQEFRKLNQLQQDERYLVGVNESLKNQLAQQAQKPGSGLSRPHPSQSIFLEADSSFSVSPNPTVVSDSEKPLIIETPVAY